MICGKCGNTIEDESIFCPCCGQRVNEPEEKVVEKEEPYQTAVTAENTVSEVTEQAYEPSDVSAEVSENAAAGAYVQPEAPKAKKEFFGAGAFILCLAVIAILSASTGTFAFLYFSAIGAI